ncbi:hypothetical protein GOP47_0020968 [Adiantum capillus-veneris]|uniref:Cyanobacterial aminoacyl-tRNA synthetase CAAD domain-containing protein n=1 Tax=Adiantum capillus-veneris TaxID=13818 RepID=A0A9D4Z6L5_ADICA|nr:hypothetical protein GOP47_0020968 [Adiantum capillus-veneris]
MAIVCAVVPVTAMSRAFPASSCCALVGGRSSPSLPSLLPSKRCLRILPHMSNSSFSARRSRCAGVCVRATTSSSEDSGMSDASRQIQEIFDDLKMKYDALENKSQVWIYGGGALVALWFSSIIVGAVNNIPLLPKVLEFVGLCYSGWFVYRYLLFKSSRKQLAADIEELKLKITGVPRSYFMTEDDE